MALDQQLQFIQNPGIPNLDQWKYGAMGGVMAGQQMDQYSKAQQLQELANQLQMQQRMSEMKEYGLDAESRATKRESDIATNRATTAIVGRGKEADVAAKELTLRKDRATAESDIAATNSKNETTQVENRRKMFESAIEELDSLNFQGPQAVNQAMAWAEKHKVPEQIKQMIGQARTPEQLQQIVRMTKSGMVNNLAQIRASQLQEQKDTAHASSAREVANIQAGASRYATDKRTQTENQSEGAVRARVRSAMASIGDKPLDQMSPEEKKVLQLYDQVAREDRTKAVKDSRQAAILGGITDMKSINDLVENEEKTWWTSTPDAYQRYKAERGQAPTFGKTQGKMKVGTVKGGFRYNGGNEADQANWTKVQ